MTHPRTSKAEWVTVRWLVSNMFPFQPGMTMVHNKYHPKRQTIKLNRMINLKFSDKNPSWLNTFQSASLSLGSWLKPQVMGSPGGIGGIGGRMGAWHLDFETPVMGSPENFGGYLYYLMIECCNGWLMLYIYCLSYSMIIFYDDQWKSVLTDYMNDMYMR